MSRAASPSLGVVIPAAGSGERMGGVQKAFLEVGGRPLLRWSLDAFLDDPRVVRVSVVLPPASERPSWLSALAPRVAVVDGGTTRTASVAAGLAALGPDVEVVVVHDAARPLVDRRALDACIERAAAGGAAVVGHPVVDTLKEVRDRHIVGSPDRASVWQVQTPQVFARRLLERAYHEAIGLGTGATDCAALVERLGEAVQVIEGSRWNVKVTYPEDRVIAECLLAESQRPRQVPVPHTEWEWDRVVGHLRRGGLLAYPTGTVYGFGGRATAEGLQALARLKMRNVADRPFLILIDQVERARMLRWNDFAERLATTFWPGPLTLILDDPEGRFPTGVRGPEGGVAVRLDAHPVPAEIVRRLGEPITSSSANRPGRPPARTAAEARAALRELEGGGDVLVVDGGPSGAGAPSTLVDLTGPVPRVVREGAISSGRIAELVPLHA
ncbi:MAG: 2-C-methyl-D-erythritol 4-phosphate cytidylyltransferase [Gemmatimonadota bacterium]